MIELDEIVGVLKVEYIPLPIEERPRLDEFLFAKWGKTEEVYQALQLVVKSCAEYAMEAFDSLPKDIRGRLSENLFDLDQVAILDHYSTIGEKATFHAISQMEGTAARLTEAAFWKSLGLTPFAKFKKTETHTYEEAVRAKWEAGKEAVRRQNARANKDAAG